MSVMNIDKHLGKAKNRIYRVGVEMEGGWEKVPPGVELAHDGSVSVSATPVDVLQPDGTIKKVQKKLYLGEIPSEILEPSKVGTFIRTYHPHAVNQSCGLHVHMSFKSARHYSLLMTKDFQETMIEYLKRWATGAKIKQTHALWPRLRGENSYCRHEYFADVQALAENKNYGGRDRPGSRYTVINYCYKMHNTLECRVLPMFEDPEQSVAAVQAVIDITNACLVYLRRKEEKHVAAVPYDIKPGSKEQAKVTILPEQEEEVEEYYV